MPIQPVEVAHLLRRVNFGVTNAEVDAVVASARTRNAAVDAVMDLSDAPTAPPPAMSDRNGIPSEWWKATSWWLERMRTTPVGIIEKLTLFWHDHFVSSFVKVTSMEMLMQQHTVLRTNALGDYAQLAGQIAVDPAMLIYLDNYRNRASGPQENFARELCELFTLGVGNYDEHDVGDLARAWTGHGLGKTTRAHQFYANLHDDGLKTIFGLPAQNWDGPATVTEILTGAKAVPASEFITAKVFSWLAYPVTPAETPVSALAAGFRKSGLDIATLVRSILRSPEFWSERAQYALVRSPVEWMVASLKALDLPVADVVKSADFDALGQVPFGHLSVNGWGSNGDWVSTGSSWSRAAWASRIRWNSRDAGVFAGLETSTPAEIADAGFERFGILQPSNQTRSVVEAWAARTQSEGDEAAISLNLPMLMMLSPEFQVS